MYIKNNWIALLKFDRNAVNFFVYFFYIHRYRFCIWRKIIAENGFFSCRRKKRVLCALNILRRLSTYLSYINKSCDIHAIKMHPSHRIWNDNKCRLNVVMNDKSPHANAKWAIYNYKRHHQHISYFCDKELIVNKLNYLQAIKWSDCHR